MPIFGMSRDHNRKHRKHSDWVNRFRNITICFAKTRHYLQLVVCVWGNVQFSPKTSIIFEILYISSNAFYRLQNLLLYFENDPLSPSFFDVFYCGHVTYQMWAWFETFVGNMNQTNTVNFDAHWISGAKKRRFWDFLSIRQQQTCS